LKLVFGHRAKTPRGEAALRGFLQFVLESQNFATAKVRTKSISRKSASRKSASRKAASSDGKTVQQSRADFKPLCDVASTYSARGAGAVALIAAGTRLLALHEREQLTGDDYEAPAVANDHAGAFEFA
jgi:hypothetical protein